MILPTDDHYPMVVSATEENTSHRKSLDNLEPSGNKIVMNGPIVRW